MVLLELILKKLIRICEQYNPINATTSNINSVLLANKDLKLLIQFIFYGISTKR